MSATQQNTDDAEKWERQARRNKPLAYIFLIAGTIAFLMGMRSGDVAVMLIGIWLAPAIAFPDKAKSDEGQPFAEKKVEAKAEADPEAKAKQAANTLEALGKLFEVFGSKLGDQPAIAEAIAVEAGEMLLNLPTAPPSIGII